MECGRREVEDDQLRKGRTGSDNLREATTEDEDMLPIPANHPFHLDHNCKNCESDIALCVGVCVACYQ